MITKFSMKDKQTIQFNEMFLKFDSDYKGYLNKHDFKLFFDSIRETVESEEDENYSRIRD